MEDLVQSCGECQGVVPTDDDGTSSTRKAAGSLSGKTGN